MAWHRADFDKIEKEIKEKLSPDGILVNNYLIETEGCGTNGFLSAYIYVLSDEMKFKERYTEGPERISYLLREADPDFFGITYLTDGGMGIYQNKDDFLRRWWYKDLDLKHDLRGGILSDRVSVVVDELKVPFPSTPKVEDYGYHIEIHENETEQLKRYQKGLKLLGDKIKFYDQLYENNYVGTKYGRTLKNRGDFTEQTFSFLLKPKYAFNRYSINNFVEAIKKAYKCRFKDNMCPGIIKERNKIIVNARENFHRLEDMLDLVDEYRKLEEEKEEKSLRGSANSND